MTEVQRARLAMAALLGEVTHRQPTPDDQAFALVQSCRAEDGFWCPWCRRTVLMAEMCSHGGSSVWADHRAPGQLGCWTVEWPGAPEEPPAGPARAALAAPLTPGKRLP